MEPLPVCGRVSSVADMPELRVFIAESDGAWTELTELPAGERQVVRLSAPDLKEAARRRRRLPADVAVVLDLAVSVADDPRTALAAISEHDDADGVRYAGTVDGLAGLVADLYIAGVADGVTLIPVGPDDDLRPRACAALSRIQDRLRSPAA
jgi:alkanesulfonate monooxygenase SsuD/methylene tetrahydromethanopterin reductase-like flavin-dependent oxidoreductase (luciferase family)